MKSGVAAVKVKKPRAVAKRVAPKRTKRAAAATLSSPVIIKNKKAVWQNSFAPKRSAWYEPFYTRQIDTHTGVSAIVATAVLLFGMVFSYNYVDGKPFKEAAAGNVVAVSNESGPLTQTAAYAVQLLHVPGAFVDTAASPPELAKPLGPVTDQTLSDTVALIPLFKESLAETTALAFDASFGKAARIFVGSVNEMGEMANKTVAEEFNLAAVWDAITPLR